MESSDKQQLIVNGFFRIDTSSEVNNFDLKTSGVWKINLILNETYIILTHLFLVLPFAEINENKTSDLIDKFWKLESICINLAHLNKRNEFLITKILPNCEEEAHWSSFFSDNKTNKLFHQIEF